jgi:hypothetical protein
MLARCPLGGGLFAAFLTLEGAGILERGKTGNMTGFPVWPVAQQLSAPH